MEDILCRQLINVEKILRLLLFQIKCRKIFLKKKIKIGFDPTLLTKEYLSVFFGKIIM